MESKITKEELAKELNGNEYRSEYTREQSQKAKENGLVIVHGASDDLVEFEGAIYDEYGCYEGGEFRVTKKLNLKEAKPNKNNKNVINAIWCPKNENGETIASWKYETEIPYSVFKIMEDGEVYCFGIVFSIKDLE